MTTIIAIHGPMGSGKSTISSLLAKKLPQYILVDRAYFKDTMLKHVKKENRPLAKNLSEDAMFFIAKRLLDEGYNVILTEIRSHNIKKALGEKPILKTFYLQCSVEECKKRDLSRQRTSVRPEVVEEIHQKHGYPDKGDIIIDTEKYSADKCVTAILKEVEALS